MKIRILTILSMLAPAACAPDQDDGSRPATVTRDSLGIQIFENARPPEGSRLPWRIGPEPAASIGVLEGEEPYLLHRVTDATKLPDGRIVVANNGTHELRVFNAVGTHLATWGGGGEGPGEFLELWQVERWPGDSLAAWYAPRLGMSVFDADGNHGRTFWLEEVGERFTFGAPAADGSVLAIHNPEGGDTLIVQLRDGEGRVGSSFGTHPGSEPHRENVDGRRMLFWKILGGEPVWTPWGDRVAIGHTGRYEIKAFGADGSLERIPPRVRIDHDRRGGPPLGRGIRVCHGRLPRAALDGFRSGRAGPGLLRDTEGLAHLRDRRGLHPGQGPGRTRRENGASVATGAVVMAFNGGCNEQSL